jgi:hypothetical protein
MTAITIPGASLAVCDETMATAVAIMARTVIHNVGDDDPDTLNERCERAIRRGIEDALRDTLTNPTECNAIWRHFR